MKSFLTFIFLGVSLSAFTLGVLFCGMGSSGLSDSCAALVSIDFIALFGYGIFTICLLIDSQKHFMNKIFKDIVFYISIALVVIVAYNFFR